MVGRILSDTANSCPCYSTCKVCNSIGFVKVISLEKTGLEIYRLNVKTANKLLNQDEIYDDVFIMRNTKNATLSSRDYLRELENQESTCTRCRDNISTAYKLLKNSSSIDKNNIIGLCNRCKQKKNPCSKCENTIKKFCEDAKYNNKQPLKEWLHTIKTKSREDTVLDNTVQKPRPKSAFLIEESQLGNNQLHKSKKPGTPNLTEQRLKKISFELDNQSLRTSDNSISLITSTDAQKAPDRRVRGLWPEAGGREADQNINFHEQKQKDNMNHDISSDYSEKYADNKQCTEDTERKTASIQMPLEPSDTLKQTHSFNSFFIADSIKKEGTSYNIYFPETKESITHQSQISSAEIIKDTLKRLAQDEEMIKKKFSTSAPIIRSGTQKRKKTSGIEKERLAQKNSKEQDEEKLRKQKEDEEKEKLAQKKAKEREKEQLRQQKRDEEKKRVTEKKSAETDKEKLQKQKENEKQEKNAQKNSKEQENEKQEKNAQKNSKEQENENLRKQREDEEKEILAQKNAIKQEKEQLRQQNETKEKERSAQKKAKGEKSGETKKTRGQKDQNVDEKNNKFEVDMANITIPGSQSHNILTFNIVTSTKQTECKTNDKWLQLMTPLQIKMHDDHHDKNDANCLMCLGSDIEFNMETTYVQSSQMVKGNDIVLYRPITLKSGDSDEPLLCRTRYETEQDSQSGGPQNAEKTVKATILPTDQVSKVIQFVLSDRSFIEKGWTMLPTEKVVRKMNVYRMRPSRPEFDWFEHNKSKGQMLYDSGERLAEFTDNGRCRWYYKNGRLALDYYDAEETNAQQRIVIFSNGEADERRRPRPYTILATFDYLGNGIVFDHGGKIRLKYNQTEGVVLDKSIGPVSHWKWHSLNDPPVLQQVMIDTHMSHKDPNILEMGAKETYAGVEDEEMLAIEFDNFIKEKSKKLNQTFKPFQIKMKALKINENFSLKILDQATVYLIFRDGTSNLKINLGMILDHKEIVDTDTAELGEVSNNVERMPARTTSITDLQKSVEYARRFERNRTERERKIYPPDPNASSDKLTAAVSRPLRPPLRTAGSCSTTAIAANSRKSCTCKYGRKPQRNSYYNARLP